MSDTVTPTTDEWMQFYDKQPPLMDGQILVPPIEGSSFSDSTVMTTSATNMPSSESILSPKGNVSKPNRRRSRASKRTPTTLLNANTTNFRALVQQFTGCPITTSSLIGVHKGPITLNFQQGSKQQIHTNTTRTFMPQIGGSIRGYDQVQQVAAAPIPVWQKQQDQVPHSQEQLLLQEHDQSGGYSFEYVKSGDFVPNPGNSSKPSMEVSDGLLLGNDFSLHDLTVNAYPTDTYYNNQ